MVHFFFVFKMYISSEVKKVVDRDLYTQKSFICFDQCSYKNLHGLKINYGANKHVIHCIYNMKGIFLRFPCWCP